MAIAPDLVRRLKRLRLGCLVPTLADRATHARQAKLSPLEFLELVLQDEIDRRDSEGLARRIAAAGFEEVVTAESRRSRTKTTTGCPRGTVWRGDGEPCLKLMTRGSVFIGRGASRRASCRA